MFQHKWKFEFHRHLFQIVDIHSGCPLGPGESGELCLKTPTLMKGYLNNPKATAATIDSDGWLHTGVTIHNN